MSVYALGIWTVKEGREDDFVAAWDAFAKGTKSEFPDAPAVLLRDRDETRKFISFGPWQSLEQMEQWRGSENFRRSVGAIRELLDGFEPHTLDVIRDLP